MSTIYKIPIILTPNEAVRFWQNVDKSQKCWLWMARVDGDGYGVFWVPSIGRSLRAPRVAFTLHYDKDPGDNLVCHRCDNPPCCRPKHLFEGSTLINALDAQAKGRLAAGDRNAMRLYPDRVPRGSKSGMAKLNETEITAIRILYTRYGHGDRNIVSLAKRFNVSKSTIGYIVKGDTWKHVS